MSEQRGISGLTITIDRDSCIGSGNCVKLAPEVFELDESGIVTFRGDAADIDREGLLESCRVCPVLALGATDADGQQLVP